jgi:hypothetical protein
MPVSTARRQQETILQTHAIEHRYMTSLASDPAGVLQSNDDDDLKITR